MKRKLLAVISLLIVVVLSFTSCDFLGSIGILDSAGNSLKGKLIGVSYTIESYDNFGSKFQTATGQNIDIEGNKIKESGYDSSGNVTTNYTLSSVITITIDGKQMVSCGSTVIFAESGLKKDSEFKLSDIDSKADGGILSITSAAKIVNKYKNYFGKPQVVVIQSQLGVPICAYSGDSVYWEIPEDLPKMTKLMIDGKALYIHRANFEIIDKSLLE